MIIVITTIGDTYNEEDFMVVGSANLRDLHNLTSISLMKAAC